MNNDYMKVKVRAIEYFLEQNDTDHIWDYLSSKELMSGGLPWEHDPAAIADALLDNVDDFAVMENNNSWYAWLPDDSAYTSVTNGDQILSRSEAMEAVEESVRSYFASAKADVEKAHRETIYSVTDVNRGRYHVLEVYRPHDTGDHYPDHFHTDNCDPVDDYSDDDPVGLWEIMTVEEYNNSILANCSVTAADFGWTDERILCIMLASIDKE